MSGRFGGALLFVTVAAANAPASAGTPELLSAIKVHPTDSSKLLVAYDYGGGGMFVSQDGAKRLDWLCSAGISSAAVSRNMVTHFGGDGSIFVGLFDGVWRGESTGCGFIELPELAGQYISGFVSDPLDPVRTYISTTTGNSDNGIYVFDGKGGPVVPVAEKSQGFISSLHVVKKGDGHRFYETRTITNADTNEVRAYVRASDDEGATWTQELYDIAQFGPPGNFADFTVAAVDPVDPNHIVALVHRRNAADSLVHSTDLGKSGSWQLLAEPTETPLAAIVFTPDGSLYFGDSDQSSKGLFVVENGSSAPRKISDGWRVFCLGYDQGTARMFGCSNYYLFGTVDLSTGALTPSLDLRCAEHIVECPGQRGDEQGM